MPHETTVEEIADTYLESWKLGLKAVADSRDGSKLSQPLSSSDKKSEKKDEKKATSESAVPVAATPVMVAAPFE